MEYKPVIKTIDGVAQVANEGAGGTTDIAPKITDEQLGDLAV